MTIAALTTEELAGQRLMVGIEGTTVDAHTAALLQTLKAGGVILFSRNIADPAQLATLCRALQDCARSCGLPPLLIAIDQEGGRVARLKAPFAVFPAPATWSGTAAAQGFGATSARDLQSVGINMDMAPVLDVLPTQGPSIMGDRCFGDDPRQVGRMGRAVVKSLQQGGIMAVGKHFPGIGRTLIDSHLDLPVADFTLSELESVDLVPFAAAIGAGVAGIMLSHILYRQLDHEFPASLSIFIARDLLRRAMGFDGLVLTDDLDMGAVKGRYDLETIAGQILAAEVDIALVCHSRPAMETLHAIFCRRLDGDAGQRQQAIAAVQRILSFKRRFLGHGA